MKIFFFVILLVGLLSEVNGGKSNTSGSKTSSGGATYPKQTWSPVGSNTATNTGSKQTGNNQGSNSGATYPKQTWSPVGTNTGTNTGNNHGTNTGTNTGYNNHGTNTGTNTGYNYGTNTGTNTGYNNHGTNTGTNTGYNNHGTNTGYNYGTNTGTNTGYNHGTNTGYNYPKQPPSNPYIGVGTNTNTNYGGVNQGNQYGGQGTHQGSGYNYQNTGHSNNYGGNYGGQNNQNTGYNTWSNPNVGRNYGYYGAGGQSIFGNQHSNYNYKKSPFGGFSGTKGLAVGGAAGFAGGAVAGASAVSVYHQYKQYQGLMHCQQYGCGDYRPNTGYGGGGGYGNNHGVLLNHQDCYGGCPNQAYCDYGICRCREGYESRYGQCWNSVDNFNARQRDWDLRSEKNYNPFHECTESRNCYDVDMNLICKSGRCWCRDDMRWNDEVSECQIFIDVDCTGLVTNEGETAHLSSSNTTSSDSNVTQINTLNVTMSENNSSDSNSSDSIAMTSGLTLASKEEVSNVTKTEENLFDKVINVTSLTANETLKDSDLTKIDPAKSSEREIKEAFCREISKTAKRYAPPTVVQIEYDSATVTAIIISIAVLVTCCCCCCCIKNWAENAYKRRRDEKLEQFERVLPLAVMESALQDNESMEPMIQVPYAPGPDNPNPNFQPPPGFYPQNQDGPYPGPEGQGPYPGGPGFQPGPDGMGYPQGSGGPGFQPGPGGMGYPQGPGGPGSQAGPGGMVYPSAPPQ